MEQKLHHAYDLIFSLKILEFKRNIQYTYKYVCFKLKKKIVKRYILIIIPIYCHNDIELNMCNKHYKIFVQNNETSLIVHFSR